MKVRLLDIAHARSGDKGDTANVGLIAIEPVWYPVLERYVTRDRVAAHFRGIIDGPVERYALPNLKALNFLLHGALDGGHAPGDSEHVSAVAGAVRSAIPRDRFHALGAGRLAGDVQADAEPGTPLRVLSVAGFRQQHDLEHRVAARRR